MSKTPKERRGLGRGLSALMADVDRPEAAAAPTETRKAETSVPIEKITANPDQPRRSFTEAALSELTESIREKGIIQPLILRPHPTREGDYEIVAGERRWRAAQRAQLHEVPAIVRTLDDTEVLELAIIENIQRADLNAVEEAAGYRQLMDRFGHTQEQVATALGKSRSYIANLLRLLSLPEAVLDMLRDGALSAGHARALITSEDPVGLAREVLKKGLSVRQTEKLAKGKESTDSKRTEASPFAPLSSNDADVDALTRDLEAALGMRVAILHRVNEGSGQVTIMYDTLEQMDDLIGRLSVTTGAGRV